uniref:Reverse transcriptase domain-containing protein n=1 Tax=Tanacetum cinerariifolium TaxID=118510 RepID=A0A6L2NLQ8_TANCI|nr:hypothetical protein [Tanacetum cinerariifolium]
MTYGQISSRFDLTYASSTITSQQPTEDTAPTPTNSSSHATNYPNTSHDVDELNPNAMFDGSSFVNPFATSSTSAAESSSSQNVDPSIMQTFYQPYPYEFQWTKDHPREQVIGEPSRPVLTWNQLQFDGDMCMYALTISTMEPKNVKEATTDPAWIESMQEDLLQFKRLDVYVDDIIFGSTHPSQSRRDLPRNTTLDRVEVLCMIEKKELCENKGIVPTEMELELEQSQQGSSHEVLIIMANPLPNHVVNLPGDEQVQPEPVHALLGFVPAVLDISNNNNGWIEEEPEEDPEMEEEDMEIEDKMNDPEIINPYEIEEGKLPPPPADSDTSFDSEPEVEAEDKDENEVATIDTITRTTVLRIMATTRMSQAAIEKLVADKVTEAIAADQVQRLEDELRSLKLRDTNIAAYTQRFNELVLLCLEAVPTEKKKVEAYIKGLPENIKGEKGLPKETKRNGKTLKVAIETTRTTEAATRTTPTTINTTTRDKEMPGHYARDCRKKAVATGANTQSTLVCYGCGEKGHTRNYYPNKNNPQGEEARGRAYVIKEADKNQGPNVVMGMFLLNNQYATILSDSGSDKSFMNTSFSHLIDIDPVRLDTSYEVKLADGRVVSMETDTQETDKNQAKNDKTKHKVEKIGKD